MTAPAESPAEGLICDVPKGEWAPFLAGLSAHFQTSPVRIAVADAQGQMNTLAEGIPLIGMEPECEPDGIRAIAVVVGDTGGLHPPHLMHRALHPTRLSLEVNPEGYARLLHIEQDDGSRTLVRFAA